MKQMLKRSVVFWLTLVLGIVVSFGVRVEAASAQTWGKLYHGPWTEWWSGTTISNFILTSDGGYAAVGTSSGYGVVVKLDANGTIEWSRIFDTGEKDTEFRSIVETQDLGYAVAGHANVTSGIGGYDIYVVRFDSGGTVLWERLYGRVTDPEHSPTEEFAQRIYENDDETLTVTGKILYAGIGDCIYFGNESGLVLNLDKDGGIISKYVLAGAEHSSEHQVYATSDAGYLVSLVRFFPSLGDYTVNLQKYGSNGGLVWTKAYYAKDGTTNEWLSGGRVVEVLDGYIISTYFSERLYLFKIDFSGNVEWQKKFNIYNDGRSVTPGQVIEAGDGGVIVSITSVYSTVDNVVIKTDQDGNLDWANLYGEGRYLRVRSSVDGGYVTAADGYDFLFAKLDGAGFLENPCKRLPVSSQPVVEETGSSTAKIDGYGPISCSGVLATTGSWTTVEVNLALSSAYSEVDACIPDLEIDSTVPVDFSSVKVGMTSSPKTVTVSNYNGLAYLLIGDVSLTGTLNFSIVSDNCSHHTAYPVNFGTPTSCDIQVVFNPKSKGLNTAHLLIPSNGIQGDVTLTGTGYLTQYTLTTSVSLGGAGSIGLDPSGGTYDEGTSVTVTPNAAPGYWFDHWTGDLTGSANPGNITMDGNKSITAVFVQQFTLTSSVSPPDGGSVGLTPSGGTYDAGTSVTVTPNAAPGYWFDHWTGDLTGSANPGHITMDGNKALSAVFVRQQHTLNTRILPPGAGSVSPAGGLYDVGTSVPLRADAETGYHFDHWEGDLTGKTNPFAITVDGDKSVTAVFLVDSGGPTVFEANPNIFGLGAMVTLSGVGFGTSKPTVMLGSLKPKVVSYKDDEIVFSLTKGLANTYLAKVIVKKVGTSNEVPCTLSAPVITGLDKTEGKQNDPVKISGKYFGIKKSKVQFVAGSGTVKSAKVVGYSDTQLDVLVPKVGVGTYQLQVQNAAGISSPVSFTVK